ncbi:MAB_1171c family putative transporter [Streptacidiphilus fuscans]|uniref:DUF6545 domain-containing protein n=1 Tax=Streptacidiphilus fuscans TaxID=2789292 RepID=A0A931B974_9ACTN|nr:MAB_1171c family putative transporter [Streptacidiphilus fuscans]MBF9071827.1 hypothetical protein [Streptacidiphilus fuscans]
MSLITTALVLILLAAAAYWALRRRSRRRPGAFSLALLLASFAVALSTYQPAIRSAEEAVTPDLSKLICDIATLYAAYSVSSLLLHLNYEAAEARRRLRTRAKPLLLALLVMLGSFFTTPSSRLWSSAYVTAHWTKAPLTLHLYDAAFVSYIGYAVYDCLSHTWSRARAAERASQRFGLRMTAIGCGFALLYATYKIIDTVVPVFGWDPFPGSVCTSPVTPTRCAFSDTAPVISILLITGGLTLPAVLWPLTEWRRRRWERSSIAELEPLWSDITNVLPGLRLPSDGTADDMNFVLHRRAVEIWDGIRALRPYRSLAVQEEATRAIAAHENADSESAKACIEAAVLADALQAHRAGKVLLSELAPYSGPDAGAGNLHANITWLRSVARAYRTARTSVDPLALSGN